MWRRLAAVSWPAPNRPAHSGSDRVVPVAAPRAPSFGLRAGPFPGLRGSGTGHTLTHPGPESPAPAESGRRAGGAGGATGVSAVSPGARLCARAGRGRAVTRRARRIPDSAAHLRSPLARLQQPPPHGEYPRPVARRLPHPTPGPYSFFRLVLIWVPAAVCIIIPKESVAALPSRPPPTSSPTPSAPLKLQEPARAPRAALAAAPRHCVGETL